MDDGIVHIQVLHIDDCPNWVEVGRRLREALDAAGLHETVITYHAIHGADDAKRAEFAGSPTILLNGSDMFPHGDRTSEVACRVYPTPNGLAGTPTTQQLIDVLNVPGR